MFGIGQKVRVKDFNELRDKYILDENGNIIINEYMFDRQQKIFCGETYRITDRFDNIYELDIDSNDNWYFSEEVLELPNVKTNALAEENAKLKEQIRNLTERLNKEPKILAITDEIEEDVLEVEKSKKRAYIRKGKA